jgi:hypothetical protein
MNVCGIKSSLKLSIAHFEVLPLFIRDESLDIIIKPLFQALSISKAPFELPCILVDPPLSIGDGLAARAMVPASLERPRVVVDHIIDNLFLLTLDQLPLVPSAAPVLLVDPPGNNVLAIWAMKQVAREGSHVDLLLISQDSIVTFELAI